MLQPFQYRGGVARISRISRSYCGRLPASTAFVQSVTPSPPTLYSSITRANCHSVIPDGRFSATRRASSLNSSGEGMTAVGFPPEPLRLSEVASETMSVDFGNGSRGVESECCSALRRKVTTNRGFLKRSPCPPVGTAHS